MLQVREWLASNLRPSIFGCGSLSRDRKAAWGI
jgi:hypothetical protein